MDLVLAFVLRCRKGAESCDSAQDREPVKRLAESFGSLDLRY